MSDQAIQVRDDLTGQIEGDLLFDELSRVLYSTDASIYQVRPLGVVVPRHAHDVATAVTYAAQNRIPIAPRGGGSGVAGESLCAGLVLDFSRYMGRIVSLDPDARTVRVQPGVVYERLGRALAPHRLVFGPDPASGSRATLGGMIGTDATGAHSLIYGYTRQYVESVQAVLANGDVVTFGPEGVGTQAPARDSHSTFRRSIVDALATTLADHQPLIESKVPRCPRHHTGYQLQDVLHNGALAVPKLLAGSEGTLAVVTEATLRVVPAPTVTAAVLLHFETLEAAAQAVVECLRYQPSACEMMDHRLLHLAREVNADFRQLLPDHVAAVLLVEHQGETLAEVEDRIGLTIDRVCRRLRLGVGASEAHTPDEQARLWQMRKTAVPLLYRAKGPSQPVAFIEDASVPPEHLPEYVNGLLGILKKHELTVSLYGHAGAGALHTRPFLNLREAADVTRMEQVAAEVYALVLRLGGSISGEHGDGLVRTQFIKDQVGPLYDVFREVKALFDPHRILNPGKIVSDEPHLMTKNLRLGPTYQFHPVPTSLQWGDNELVETAERCNGCAQCRSLESAVRMCPVFRALRDERYSPRGKANLIRAILAGQIAPDRVFEPPVKHVLDQCLGCTMCSLECPAGVNVAKLIRDLRASYVARHGLSPTEWGISRAELVSRLGSTLAPLANLLLDIASVRWLMDKFGGIDRRRRMPAFAARSFVRRTRHTRRREPTPTPTPRVAYFVDLFANYNDPELGDAVVAVLEHNGVEVHVPPRQKGCGMPLLSYGDLHAARKVIAYNLRYLTDVVEQGYTIVCSEPTATLALTREYLEVVDDIGARLVAEHTMDVCHYLWQRHLQGQLQTDLRELDVSIGYHAPCHLKALEIGLPCRDLLQLIPGTTVRTLDEGCCGLGGTFGMRTTGFDTAMAAGRGLFHRMRQSDIDIGASSCSACRMQIEQGSAKPTLHPVKLLALAYDLIPQIARALTPSPRPA